MWYEIDLCSLASCSPVAYCALRQPEVACSLVLFVFVFIVFTCFQTMPLFQYDKTNE